MIIVFFSLKIIFININMTLINNVKSYNYNYNFIEIKGYSLSYNEILEPNIKSLPDEIKIC